MEANTMNPDQTAPKGNSDQNLSEWALSSYAIDSFWTHPELAKTKFFMFTRLGCPNIHKQNSCDF